MNKLLIILVAACLLITTLSTHQLNNAFGKNFMNCTEDEKCWDTPKNLADNNYHPDSTYNHLDNNNDDSSDNNDHSSNNNDNIEIHTHNTHHKNSDIVIYEYSEPIQQVESPIIQYEDNTQVFDTSNSDHDFNVNDMLNGEDLPFP